LLKKVLIANRGEIALRIIRACKELGIATVAVYSEADEDSLHVMFADETICIGPAQSSDSYLNQERILAAAEITGADAIHPGFGFLAENAQFAEKCHSCDIKFIGPSPKVIDKMGHKSVAKETVKKAGVPVVPGTDGIITDIAEAKKLAEKMGYPVILKAVAGGGGKGMRLVREPSEFENAYQMAATESGAAFGNPDLYLEKYIEEPRHIEIQIMADQMGNVVYLGERECSIQRRHQKLLEESPSPALTPEKRKEMGEMAARAAKEVGYEGAGTIEFLYDKHGNYYFMEMNTRIQVEHPVTELVYNVDLVKEQIRVASGLPLQWKQEDLIPLGHAIECRINAEDPDANFMPSPGKVIFFHTPGGPGIRVDSHVYSDYVIPPFYDSMVAKLIAFGSDREEAVSRMRRALDEFRIEGIKTTIPFHQRLIVNEDFKAGNFDTGFLEKNKI
jgi:acetyl-CoA carboxylase biotin carboxylase subunit